MVCWALQRDEGLRSVAGAAFFAALRRLPESTQPTSVDARAWRGLGRTDPVSQRALINATRREVLVPCSVAPCDAHVVDCDDSVAPTDCAQSQRIQIRFGHCS